MYSLLSQLNPVFTITPPVPTPSWELYNSMVVHTAIAGWELEEEFWAESPKVSSRIEWELTGQQVSQQFPFHIQGRVLPTPFKHYAHQGTSFGERKTQQQIITHFWKIDLMCHFFLRANTGHRWNLSLCFWPAKVRTRASLRLLSRFSYPIKIEANSSHWQWGM